MLQPSPFIHQMSGVPSPDAAASSPAPAAPRSTADELARIFNTAVLATRFPPSSLKDFSGELAGALQSPAFQAIMVGVRQHAANQRIGERQAAEEVIAAFRKIDQIWEEYVIQEGIERVRG